MIETFDALWDKMKAEFDKINQKMDKRFIEMENKFDEKLAILEEKMDKRFIEMENKFDKEFTNLEEKYDNRFVNVENKLDAITNVNLAQILNEQTITRKELTEKLDEYITKNEFEHKRIDYKLAELEYKYNSKKN